MPFRRRLPRRSLGEGGCPAPRITTSYCDFMAACLHQTSQSKHQTFLCGKTYAYGMRERLQHLYVKRHVLRQGTSMPCLIMNETQGLGALICFGCVTAMAVEQSATTSPSASPAELEFDHVWIVVTRDAPERAVLETTGLKISPDVNRHDGQGTASITADLQNPYIELMW